MRINVFALLAMAVSIFALFLPWVSFGNVLLYEQFTCAWSHRISPFQYALGYLVLNQTTNSVFDNYQGVAPMKPMTILSNWVGLPSDSYINEAPKLVLFFATLVYLFAIGLMAQTSFTNGSWSKIGKTVSFAASNLLFVTTLLWILSLFWCVFAIAYGGRADAFPPTMGFMHLDFGFWAAIFGAVFAFVSWLHPKVITVDIKIKTGAFNTFKQWLPVAEWEKSLAIAVASFLAVFIFAIFYFPLP